MTGKASSVPVQLMVKAKAELTLTLHHRLHTGSNTHLQLTQTPGGDIKRPRRTDGHAEKGFKYWRTDWETETQDTSEPEEDVSYLLELDFYSITYVYEFVKFCFLIRAEPVDSVKTVIEPLTGRRALM